MPPVAKPTSVIVHRIELQKTERDMLEAAVMVNAVGKVGQAAGALIAPFAGALTAIVAAYIAKEGIEDIAGWAAKKVGEKEEMLANAYAGYLDAVSRALAARDREGELMVPLDHPSRERPPMTRAEFDELYEKGAMTNWELLQYRVAEATGGLLGNEPEERTSRSDAAAEELNCVQITRVYGAAAGAACRVAKAKAGTWWFN